MKSNSDNQVYQIIITLAASKPPIWRRFQIDPNETLYKLHQSIQVIMGWTNSHMHLFRQGRNTFGKPDKAAERDFGFETLDEKKFKISQVLDKPKSKLIYEYDMGDSWEHILVFEKWLPINEKQHYPFCLDGAMACPPEDCGGIPGFYNLLEIIENPNHEEHDDMVDWLGDKFDPEVFEVGEINKLLKRV